MKKLIITLLISLFFVADVSASTTINKMDINVKIDSSGMAIVNETWIIPKQNSNEITKIFYASKNSKITDITLKDSNNHEYTYAKNMKNKLYNYKLDKKGKNSYLLINTDGNEKTITLNYKIDGMIKSYKDLDGINWYFVDTSNKMDIKSLSLAIEGEYPYNDGNVGLYGIGNNIECSINDGKIILNAGYLGTHSKILLLTTFTNTKFKNTIKINNTFSEYYKKNKPSMINEIRNFLASETVLIFILVITLVTMIIILKLCLHKKNSIFDSLIIKSRVNLISSVSNATYYELIPCESDFYHLEFLTSLFNITKSRSNIIASIILKWIFNGCANMDVENKTIILKENLKFTNDLDQKLYDLLIDTCGSYKIKKNVLNKNMDKYQEKFDEWFISIYKYAIKKEYNKGNIKINKKKLIVSDEVVKTANELIGLKKYLLNFNQVPRENKLTPKIYEELLIASCLLGLSNSLSKEILRKNKDNNLAHTLEDFCEVREILLPTYSIKNNKVDFIECIKE